MLGMISEAEVVFRGAESNEGPAFALTRFGAAGRVGVPARARVSVGWYRYGESNPGSKVENLVS